MNLLQSLGLSVVSTVQDILPIAVVVAFFQLVVLKRAIPRWQRVAAGFGLLLLGLGVFLVGLQVALFPLGEAMAKQLSSPEFVQPNGNRELDVEIGWGHYYWTYAFAFGIGFSAVLAEPGLLAIAERTWQLSGGTIRPWGLRSAVALGSGTGFALGTLRITTGLPLLVFAGPVIALIAVLTYVSPKQIIALAYDSGVIATSTITVPLITALGVGLATQIPGREPLRDGFGMIAIAALCPIITVMAYAIIAHWWIQRTGRS